jgi:hypothetical protein
MVSRHLLAIAISTFVTLPPLAARALPPTSWDAAAPGANPNDAAIEQQRVRLLGALPAALRPKVLQAAQSLAANFPAGANPLTAARSTVAAAKNFGTSPSSDQVEVLAWIVLMQTYSSMSAQQTKQAQTLQSIYDALSNVLKKASSTASSVISNLK